MTQRLYGSFGSALLLAAFAAPASSAVPLPAVAEALHQDAAVPAVVQAPASAPQAVIVEADGGGTLTEARLFAKLRGARVVYAGEKHDEALHHGIQRAVLEGLHSSGADLAVGLEMVAVTSQTVLDDYVSGAMSEAEFAGFWKEAWGFDFELYRPVLEYARANRIPLVALNAPMDVVRQVARGGLASLSPEQRSLIPDEIAEIEDPRYREYVEESLRGHPGMTPERIARMLQAQQVWNETMGRSVVGAASRRGTVLVVAGAGHMVYRSGIAESVRRRSALSQAVVLPYPPDGGTRPLPELLLELRDPASDALERGDYFWLLTGPGGERTHASAPLRLLSL